MSKPSSIKDYTIPIKKKTEKEHSKYCDLLFNIKYNNDAMSSHRSSIFNKIDGKFNPYLFPNFQ